MTILVGIIDKQNQKAVLCSDTMISMGYHSCPTDATKIHDFGFLTLACCGTVRGINVIEAYFNPPHIGWEEDAYRYMLEKFIPALMLAYKHGGILEDLDDVKYGANGLVVAIDGRLFSVGMDFSVIEYTNYLADGCGYEYAYGSLYSTRRKKNVIARAEEAVAAAAEFDKGCGRDIHFYEQPRLDRDKIKKLFEDCAKNLNKAAGITKKDEKVSAEDILQVGMDQFGNMMVVEKEKG